jgi:hypothetical protein
LTNGTGVGDGVGDGVGVGLGVAVGPVGVGVAGAVYVISRAGRFPAVPFSLESNRFAAESPVSLPLMIHPELPDGLSSQDCTSATTWAELQV